MQKLLLLLVLLLCFSLPILAQTETRSEEFQINSDDAGSRGFWGNLFGSIFAQQTFVGGSGETFQPGNKARFTVNYKPRGLCLDTFYVLEIYKDGSLFKSVDICDSSNKAKNGDHPCRSAGKSVLQIDEEADLSRTFWMDFSVDLPSNAPEGNYGVDSYILCMNQGFAVVSSVEEGSFTVKKPAPPPKYSESCKKYSGQCQDGKYLLTDLNVAASDATNVCEYVWKDCSKEKTKGYCSKGECKAGCDPEKKTWNSPCSTKGVDGCGETVKRDAASVEGASCGAGKTCQSGECVKDDTCSINSDCDQNEECVLGACVKKASTGSSSGSPSSGSSLSGPSIPSGSSESSGSQKQDECATDKECETGKECILGKCISSARSGGDAGSESGFLATLNENKFIVGVVVLFVLSIVVILVFQGRKDK